jgi:hypothetical protein
MLLCRRCPEVLRETVRFGSRRTVTRSPTPTQSRRVVLRSDRWLGPSNLRARPRGTRRSCRTFPSASIAICLITMSSAASSRTASKTATAPLEAAAQMSPRTVLLRRWRSRKADGLRNTSDPTAPAYDGLGDAGYVTITGMAKTWSEIHRRRTVHDRSAGAARVYLGRPSRLHRKGRNTTGDSSRLLLDRRPGRDPSATTSPKVTALSARPDVALNRPFRDRRMRAPRPPRRFDGPY